MRPLILLLGGPGTGKTETLLGVMERALRAGVEPERIAFVSHTNAAVDEARARAVERLGVEPKRLRHFRTLHSLCYRALGLTRNDLIYQKAHARELLQRLGVYRERWGIAQPRLGDLRPGLDAPPAVRDGFRYLFVEHYSRLTGRPLREVAARFGVRPSVALAYAAVYREFKAEKFLLDFTDLLGRFADGEGLAGEVDLAIVDEGQDLSPLHVRAAARALGAAPELWVAGDVDQSVHRWAGAIGAGLLDVGAALGRRAERTVLTVNYRVPASALRLANVVLARLAAGERAGEAQTSDVPDGLILARRSLEQLDLEAGTWLLLARTRGQLAGYVAACRRRGVHYAVHGLPAVDPAHLRAVRAYEALRAAREVAEADRGLVARYRPAGAPPVTPASPLWHDGLTGLPLREREYYLMCLRRGEKLTGPPRVRVATVHGAKGLEAENVALVVDLTANPLRAWRDGDGGELRLLYTGLTRTRRNLFFVRPERGPREGYPVARLLVAAGLREPVGERLNEEG